MKKLVMVEVFRGIYEHSGNEVHSGVYILFISTEDSFVQPGKN